MKTTYMGAICYEEGDNSSLGEDKLYNEKTE